MFLLVEKLKKGNRKCQLFNSASVYPIYYLFIFCIVDDAVAPTVKAIVCFDNNGNVLAGGAR